MPEVTPLGPTAGRDPRFTRTAILILLVLALVRILAVILAAPPVVADAAGYDAAALRLLQGGSFAYPAGMLANTATGDPVMTPAGFARFLEVPANSYTMPGHPFVLAGVYRVFGSGAERFVWARVMAALLSVGTAALVYLIARRFGERVALVALGLVAVYPPLTLANLYLTTEPLYTFMVVWFAFAFLAWVDRRSWPSALAAGAILSAGMLVRPALAFWIPVAVIGVWIASAGRRRKTALQIGAMALAAMLVMAPWWVRNVDLYGQPIWFTSSAPVNILEGIRADLAEPVGLPVLGRELLGAQPDLGMRARIAKIDREAPLAAQDDLAFDKYYARQSALLARYTLTTYRFDAVLARARATAVSIVWPSAVSQNAARGIPFLVSVLLHVAMLALFAVGAVVLPKRTDTWLLLSIPLYFLVFHAAILPNPRYYSPSAPLALIVSAFGLCALWRTRESASGAPEAAPGQSPEGTSTR